MQADLFNLSMPSPLERQAFQRTFFEKKYQFRTDQLIGASLVLIVFFVLVFAWGVEHGKAVTHRDQFSSISQPVVSAIKSPVPVVRSQAAPVLQGDVAISPTVEIADDVKSVVSPAKANVKAIDKSAPAASSKYTIAHVTYLKKDQAKREIDRIQAQGYSAFLASSGHYFQICVSGFASRKDANDAMKTMRVKGIVSPDSYIRNMPA